MTRKHFYPAWLDMSGVPVLVVGAGRVAHRKTKPLLEAGADLRVVAPNPLPDFENWARDSRLYLDRRAFEPSDLQRMQMVFACTDNTEINSMVVESARNRGIWVSSATPADHSNFHVGAVLRQGGLSISISTGRQAPILGRVLKDCLEDLFSSEWSELVEDFSSERSQMLSRGEEITSLESDIRRAFAQSVRRLMDSTAG